MSVCDNASRVIKYVMLLGYRYSHYNLVDMRIHDINVEADLTTLDPNAPESCDGTTQGIAKESDTTKANDDSETSAQSCYKGEWKGLRPTYHIKGYHLATVVLHIAIDILLTITLVTETIFHWFESLFDVDSATFEFIVGLVLEVLQDGVVFVATQCLLFTSLCAFLVFDYTRMPAALALGALFWILTAAFIEISAQTIFDRIGNYIASAAIWLLLFLSVISLLFVMIVFGVPVAMIAVANMIFLFLIKMGQAAKFAEARFAWVTVASLLLMGALCIFKIFHYAQLFNSGG